MINRKEKRIRRHARVRSKVNGTAKCPRLSIYKSNKGLYAQLIDDDKNVTLLSADTMSKKGKTLTDKAIMIGKDLATKALDKKITNVVFDRGGFSYAGVIKAFADSARNGGLKF